jgi:hypothetical protein
LRDSLNGERDHLDDDFSDGNQPTDIKPIQPATSSISLPQEEEKNGNLHIDDKGSVDDDLDPSKRKYLRKKQWPL